MRWLPRLSVATRLRLGIALLAALLAALDGSLLPGLPWLLLVVTLDLAASGFQYLSESGNAIGRGGCPPHSGL